MSSNDNLITMLHLALEKCNVTFPRLVLATLENCPECRSMVIAAIKEWERTCDCEKYNKEKEK